MFVTVDTKSLELFPDTLRCEHEYMVHVYDVSQFI
jgi:hypothetical protein